MDELLSNNVIPQPILMGKDKKGKKIYHTKGILPDKEDIMIYIPA